MLRVTLILLAPLCPLSGQAPPVAAAEATFVVEGQVVDLRGEPVPMAGVQVFTAQQRDLVLARGMCDGEGCFRLGRVPKRDSWIVRAESPGRCAAEGHLAGEPVPLRIALHDAAVVRGVLRQKDGTPVGGTAVRADLLGQVQGLRVPQSAPTDAGGGFTLPAVPLGFVRLSAVVPGEGLAEVETVVRGECEVTLAPLKRATTSLEVLVEGMPKEALEQVRVMFMVTSREGGTVGLPAPWDRPRFEQGRLELQWLPNWSYQVSLSAPGFTFAGKGDAAMNHGPHRLKFTASPLVRAERRCPAVVRDGAGRPVPGLRLSMSSATGRGGTTEAISDDAGRLTFTTALAAGSTAVVASLDDRFVLEEVARPDHGVVLVYRHECKVDPATVIELRVVAACSVQGRVLLADGRPAAFVTVGFQEWLTGHGQLWVPIASTATDREGNYRFAGLHHLRRQVQVSVKGSSGAGTSDELSLEAGTGLRLPDLKLEPPAVVEGTVVDAAGKLAPGIRVMLRRTDSVQGWLQDALTEVITDRLGRYRFVGVRRGDVSLQFLLGAVAEGAVPTFAVEAGQTCRHDLKLPAQ